MLDQDECTHWVSSITTRIKTPSLPPCWHVWERLIEYLPLQQGLRLDTGKFFRLTENTHWVSSITTRIKTSLHLVVIQLLLAHWVSSITTRIKTHSPLTLMRKRYPLIEYLPLQQGLRHSVLWCNIAFSPTHWVSSITTRIKTVVRLHITFFNKRSLSIFHYNKD